MARGPLLGGDHRLDDGPATPDPGLLPRAPVASGAAGPGGAAAEGREDGVSQALVRRRCLLRAVSGRNDGGGLAIGAWHRGWGAVRLRRTERASRRRADPACESDGRISRLASQQLRVLVYTLRRPRGLSATGMVP